MLCQTLKTQLVDIPIYLNLLNLAYAEFKKKNKLQCYYLNCFHLNSWGWFEDSIEFGQLEFGQQNFDKFDKIKTHLGWSQNRIKECLLQYSIVYFTLNLCRHTHPHFGPSTWVSKLANLTKFDCPNSNCSLSTLPIRRQLFIYKKRFGILLSIRSIDWTVLGSDAAFISSISISVICTVAD